MVTFLQIKLAVSLAGGRYVDAFVHACPTQFSAKHIIIYF